MRTMRRLFPGWLRALTLIFGLAPALMLATPASAHGANHPAPKTWHVSVGIETKDHAIQGMSFLVPEIWINQGDTVVWTSHSGEIHTVTFLKPGQERPPFNPNDPTQTGRVGGSHYEGHSYFNSGLLLGAPGGPLPQTYSLTFDVTGTFHYICLVHSMMNGVVHVRPSGTHYPFTQKQYDHQAKKLGNELIKHGRALERSAAKISNDHHVTLGIGDGAVAVMRYIPGTIRIHRNDSVTFTNRDAEAPHTVTFGPDPADGGFAPAGGKTFTGAPINSGFLGDDPHWFGKSVTFKFATAGTFEFRCVLHDDLGMVIKIVVS